MANIELAQQQLDAHLRREEGERLYPYLCDAGVPTIGVGATTYLDGRKVKLSDPPISREQMDRMLKVEIDRYITRVMEMVDNDCTTNQLVALVLLGYNIGLGKGGLETSTVIRCHRAGDYAGAGRAFSLWNKYRPAGPGTQLVEHPSLTARRLREAALYATADDPDQAARMPQAVEPESKPTASPITRGGLVTIGAGVLEGLRQMGDSLGGIRAPLDAARGLMVDTLGVPPEWILPLVLIAAGALVVRWRWLQRSGGWA